MCARVRVCVCVKGERERESERARAGKEINLTLWRPELRAESSARSARAAAELLSDRAPGNRDINHTILK